MSAQKNRYSLRSKLNIEPESQSKTKKESDETNPSNDDKNEQQVNDEQAKKETSKIDEEDQKIKYEYKLEPLARSHPSLSLKHEHLKRIKQSVRFTPNESSANDENQSPDEAKVNLKSN